LLSGMLDAGCITEQQLIVTRQKCSMSFNGSVTGMYRYRSVDATVMGEVAEVASRYIYSQSSVRSAEAGSIVDVVRGNKQCQSNNDFGKPRKGGDVAVPRHPDLVS
jgi:hypothetical protein